MFVRLEHYGRDSYQVVSHKGVEARGSYRTLQQIAQRCCCFFGLSTYLDYTAVHSTPPVVVCVKKEK